MPRCHDRAALRAKVNDLAATGLATLLLGLSLAHGLLHPLAQGLSGSAGHELVLQEVESHENDYDRQKHPHQRHQRRDAAAR